MLILLLVPIGRLRVLMAMRTLRGLSTSTMALWVGTIRTITVMFVALETDSRFLIFRMEF